MSVKKCNIFQFDTRFIVNSNLQQNISEIIAKWSN